MIIDRIARETGLERAVLEKIVHSANHRYKVYSIRKRREGWRRIEHPSRELKFLQTWIARNVVSKLLVHEAAMAYRRGINISDAATHHRHNNFLLLLDFANFFGSIHQTDVFKVIQANMASFRPSLEEEDVTMISRVATRYGRLTVGAPSSPQISNAVLYEFDAKVTRLCQERGVVYSRYADDMHFSTDAPNVLGQLAKEVGDLVVEIQRKVPDARRHRRDAFGPPSTLEDLSVLSQFVPFVSPTQVVAQSIKIWKKRCSINRTTIQDPLQPKRRATLL